MPKRDSDRDYLGQEFSELEQELPHHSHREEQINVTVEEVLSKGLRPTLLRIQEELIHRAAARFGNSVVKTAKAIRSNRRAVRRVFRKK